MRVAWVHPSWRDLVIEHLGSSPDARERFLRNCSVHGALLALSLGGGLRGERQLPLLRHDADWDALTDRLYTLVPELEPTELFGLFDALALTIDDASGTSTAPEANALAAGVLVRLAAVWTTTRKPTPLPPLEGWFTLAKRLSPRPQPPAIPITWAELLPTAPPRLSDRPSLERFADWLTLADLLMDHDPQLLADLGFPGHTERFCEQFLDLLDPEPGRVAPADVDLAVRALGQIIDLIPSLADRADTIRFLLKGDEYLSASSSRRAPASEPIPQTGYLDVRRVLADL
jgi:hypothetical protein